MEPVRTALRRVVPRTMRLWVRHPWQSLRWARLSFAGRHGGSARLAMLPGWELTCHPAAVEAFAFERDQPELRAELEAFVAECRPGMVLFDIGAHFGLFALAALRWSGGDARVVAVEPSAAALDVFDANMRLAGAAGRVERYAAALSDRAGRVDLLTGGAGGWHMMVGAGEGRPDVVAVEALTLDALVERAGVDPTHIKIDVEGQEAEVLRGAASTLRRVKPLLFLELHVAVIARQGRSAADVLGMLAEWGYRALEIGGARVLVPDALRSDVARIVCRPC